ncbi:MAG TPA: hypothetical protein VGJ14_00930 [Sporichthyaceae bacterium]
MPTNSLSQRICVWSGPLMAVTLLTAFLIMGFLPPPDPRLSGEQIVALFAHDQQRIQVGGIVMILGSALLFPWVSVITVQLRRIEGEHAPMATTQLASGALGAFLFLTPMIAVQAMAFQPDRLAPQVASTMYYFVWLFFVGTPVFAVVQNAAIAIAILTDTRSEPVFPRWAGYFNLWIAVLFTPGIITYFFDSGPFAWRGIFPWWIPLSFFGVWFAVMTTLLLKAINQQTAMPDAESPSRPAVPEYRTPTAPGASLHQ